MIFSFINLGCSKNLVDTQFLLGKILSKWGDSFFYNPDPFSDSVEFVFLNTCGFISSGRTEMFENIDTLLSIKKKVCLLGCAVQYFEKLAKENLLSDDETNHWESIKNNKNIIFLSWKDFASFSPAMIGEHFQRRKFSTGFVWGKGTRAYTNSELGFEYLKIAEGCNNQCAYCIIPKIRGKQQSLSIETILQEAKRMIKQGIKEIILIAQDSTRYGIDLYGDPKLFELLEQLDSFAGDFSYRVLYLYPDLLTKQHLKRLTTLKKFIPYFDLPLQHISPDLLKSMRRYSDKKSIIELLDFIRANFSNAYIRTNFIIGFPGETTAHVDALIEFIKQGYFDNVALFEYHDEVLAPSYEYKNKLDDITIRKRFLQVQQVVDDELKKKNGERKGEHIGTISDMNKKNGEWQLLVRPYPHAPDIDEEDTILLENVLECLDGNELDIGKKIKYTTN